MQAILLEKWEQLFRRFQTGIGSNNKPSTTTIAICDRFFSSIKTLISCKTGCLKIWLKRMTRISTMRDDWDRGLIWIWMILLWGPLRAFKLMSWSEYNGKASLLPSPRSSSSSWTNRATTDCRTPTECHQNNHTIDILNICFLTMPLLVNLPRPWIPLAIGHDLQSNYNYSPHFPTIVTSFNPPLEACLPTRSVLMPTTDSDNYGSSGGGWEPKVTALNRPQNLPLGWSSGLTGWKPSIAAAVRLSISHMCDVGLRLKIRWWEAFVLYGERHHQHRPRLSSTGYWV